MNARTQTASMPAPMRLPATVTIRPNWQVTPAEDWTREDVLDASVAAGRDGNVLDHVGVQRLADECLDLSEELSAALDISADETRIELDSTRRGLSAANRQLGSMRTMLADTQDQLRAQRDEIAKLRSELAVMRTRETTARLNDQARCRQLVSDDPDAVVIDVEL